MASHETKAREETDLGFNVVPRQFGEIKSWEKRLFFFVEMLTIIQSISILPHVLDPGPIQRHRMSMQVFFFV